ncbi:MAG TPA: glycosyltransferase family 2 protein [Caulobacteraceae bacterium]|jgi:glycosyltransferase involved in cell wall biosynthesis|nr:glycosyltransferase family 2 protein [Caulobacteraceae bacterium]
MTGVGVSIVIPTQRRPEPLARAVRSCFQQGGVAPENLELIVVDNDEQGSAAALAETLAAEAPFALRYVHEPRPGVANARNAGVAATRGTFIAFLDDDEEAPPGWLAGLLDAQARFEADLVFGPVRARVPDSAGAHRGYLEHFFSRLDPAAAGPINYYYGCGDSLVRRAALPGLPHPFAEARNHIGGEDDLLFSQMRALGARIAWAPEAWVWEDPAPDRLTLRYAIRRAFVYGQGAPTHCANAVPPDRLGVAGWMIQGIAQAAIFGLLALAQWAIRAPRRAFTLDRAARGLGKTFWWSPFKVRLYGRPGSA